MIIYPSKVTLHVTFHGTARQKKTSIASFDGPENSAEFSSNPKSSYEQRASAAQETTAAAAARAIPKIILVVQEHLLNLPSFPSQKQ